jgi:hypothetical protein
LERRCKGSPKVHRRTGEKSYMSVYHLYNRDNFQVGQDLPMEIREELDAQEQRIAGL